MSRLRQTKISQPGNPPTNTEELYYDTAGPGYTTPAALCAVDSSGNRAMIAHFATLDYRFIGRQVITATGAQTYTPTAGVRAVFVECVGGGGGTGNPLVSSSNSSVSGGGGGGGYASGWVTGVSTTYSVTVGAGGIANSSGSAGGNGADTNFNSGAIIGKGGTGGAAGSTAGTTGTSAGGAGGVAGTAGTGGITFAGTDGGYGVALSATQGWGGSGGASVYGGGKQELATAVAAKLANVAGSTYGGGSSGGANIGTQTVGTGQAGGNGIAIFWEFA